jgi:hypothetical protein
MTFTEIFTIQPLAPFNFDLTAQIFSSGDLQIRSYANGEFHQVLEINSDLVLVKLTSNGTIQQPRIDVELKSNKPLTPKDRKTAANTIHYFQLRLRPLLILQGRGKRPCNASNNPTTVRIKKPNHANSLRIPR